ncbi:hypothetical protein N475_19745 [Pseudoalteromonas luteoviolacea DSM 6061]|uniref:Uncharacterized protein n=2 Tax=Pseudoalteromonas luteoviolacea TaxID=43657 RepID=A0A166VUR8_9GAMM|nr:hypothetical protein N475_19745 [Pseudoalteromonas luteoviolacea DSM 6061]MBE0389243.1 hypothetical protein [Pseudoalteromonas luteoviolacea DSM 6061]
MYTYDWMFMSFATITSCCCVLFFKKDNINVVSITALVLAMSLVEFFAFSYLIPLESETLPMIWLGSIVYGVQLILFAITCLLLLMRIRLLKLLFHRYRGVAPTYAEGLIALSLFLSSILMGLMFLENVLRNAVDLGFKGEFFGSLTKLTLIYDSYEILAYAFRSITCAFLVSMLFVVEIDTSKLVEPVKSNQ